MVLHTYQCFSLGPSIKKILFAVPLPTHFYPIPKTFLALLESKKICCPVFIRKSRFSHHAAMKEKNMQTKCFSYLPTQPKKKKKLGKSTANKHFLRVALLTATCMIHLFMAKFTACHLKVGNRFFFRLFFKNLFATDIPVLLLLYEMVLRPCCEKKLRKQHLNSI